jgi:hypothetical protein
MKRVFSLSALLFFPLLSAASVPQYSEAYPCYWVHGRLAPANGNPMWRIWPSGTKRLLGVVGNRPGDDADFASWPLALRHANPGFTRIVWGDFRVCPVTPERPGWMRFVHIKDVRVLKIQALGS